MDLQGRKTIPWRRISPNKWEPTIGLLVDKLCIGWSIDGDYPKNVDVYVDFGVQIDVHVDIDLDVKIYDHIDVHVDVYVDVYILTNSYI